MPTKITKPIYFISGLGGDERLFDKLELDTEEIYHIRLKEPRKGESLAEYAKRLSEQVKHEEIHLVGVSLGGMIAIEMAEHVNAEKVVLISSVKSHEEKPWYFIIPKIFPFHRIIPGSWVKKGFRWRKSYFSKLERMGEEDVKLLEEMFMEANDRFIMWGFDQALKWKRRHDLKLHHIHGTDDKTFPLRYIRNAETIEGGTHFMVHSHAPEVSEKLNALFRVEIE